MIILGLIIFFSALASLASSYAFSVFIFYFAQTSFYDKDFNCFAYFKCPVSLECATAGAEYQTYVLVLAGVIFILSSVVSPYFYYRRITSSS